MNVVLSLVFLGTGAAAVWAGITDPQGGLWAGLGRLIRGEPEPADPSSSAGFLGGLAALGRQAAAGAKRGGKRRGRRGSGGSGGSGAPDGYGGTVTGGSSAGNAAVAYARKQIGKPYVWGAEGPNSFDCSGLTMRAWGAAGVTIPRTTTFQHTIGKNVKGGPYAPGDLIFPAPGHVQLYAGGGQVIEAPRTGLNVRLAQLPSTIFAARRPGKG